MNQVSFPIELAPSLLSANFAHLGEDIAQVEEAGCRVLHLDVMDGHLVPNISFGPLVCAAVNRVSNLWLDAHLMIEDPGSYIEAFRDAGADQLTIHWEIPGDVLSLLDKIREKGLSPGISLRPSTPLSAIREALDRIDLVLLMSVEPGFGGQKFIPESIKRIRELGQMIDESGRLIKISVDGGINLDTIPEVVDAGATRLVAGSAVFKGDIKDNIHRLVQAIPAQV